MANSRQKCTGCKKYFPQSLKMIRTPAGKFHDKECLINHASKRDNVKKLAKKGKALIDKEERASLKRRKEALRPYSWFTNEAQRWFNRFIRYRDRHDGCISCDRTKEQVEREEGWKIGGAWDCGHYLSRGARNELRFIELNAHKQCKSCNGGSGNYSSKNYQVAARYREKLIEKIGLEMVEWLEADHLHEKVKPTKDELLTIIATYKAKCKVIEKIIEQENNMTI